MAKRVILIVLDSVGIGELPDAAEYGDNGSDTLDNIARRLGGLRVPNLTSLGLGNIQGVNEIEGVSSPAGAYGRCMEVSPGKDTTTGHWEIAGIQLDKAFPTYPNGFPEDVVKKYETLIGTKVLANKPASGTAIIEELGDEHVKTGYPILYTSADSVFQLAAHEDVIPLERLYEMCSIARDMLVGEHAVGRVIARPFKGENGSYKRTANRRDFSLNPIKPTILNAVAAAGMDVCAVGKIEDIFSGSGITKAVHTKSNMEGVDRTLEYMKEDTRGLIFTNLVDFDMLYGHRNDTEGYGRALEEFDNRLPEIIKAMGKEDVLIITADHGCDPTTPSTDHSREYIPLLVCGEAIKQGVSLGTRNSYSDIGKTIAGLLGIEAHISGDSFAAELYK